MNCKSQTSSRTSPLWEFVQKRRKPSGKNCKVPILSSNGFSNKLGPQFSPVQYFFCWRLLGLIPGGAPFSQLSRGVKDAMVVSTKLAKCHFDKNMQTKRPIETTLRRGETRIHPQRVPGLQKRAPVMPYRQPLCRRDTKSIGRRWLW